MFAEYGVLNYWTYLVGAIFIVLVPGPNTLFVLKNSVSSGMKGGYLAACGVFIGDAVLMFLAWAGEPQYGAIFKRALILSLTNPKAILFYVSFFVQFIDVNAPHTGISFFILATTLELVSFCYLSFLIISGAFVTQYIRTKKKLAKVGNSLIGLMFVGFAARLATLQS